ncbi:hypothetical protein M0638_27620, partial [Roseomonas sp. NAR14]
MVNEIIVPQQNDAETKFRMAISGYVSSHTNKIMPTENYASLSSLMPAINQANQTSVGNISYIFNGRNLTQVINSEEMRSADPEISQNNILISHQSSERQQVDGLYNFSLRQDPNTSMPNGSSNFGSNLAPSYCPVDQEYLTTRINFAEKILPFSSGMTTSGGFAPDVLNSQASNRYSPLAHSANSTISSPLHFGLEKMGNSISAASIEKPQNGNSRFDAVDNTHVTKGELVINSTNATSPSMHTISQNDQQTQNYAAGGFNSVSQPTSFDNTMGLLQPSVTTFVEEIKGFTISADVISPEQAKAQIALVSDLMTSGSQANLNQKIDEASIASSSSQRNQSAIVVTEHSTDQHATTAVVEPGTSQPTTAV